MRLCCWTLLSAHNAGSASCCRSFCVHGAPWPRFGGPHGSHARCAVTAVARGLLAGVLLGIGVQSEHRELEHGERDDPVSGMLFLRVGALMMCVGACACGSCLVRHALKLCAFPSACASAALAAASARPATAAAWPMQACLASSANTRRAVCSRHSKRLGLGLARGGFMHYALSTRGAAAPACIAAASACNLVPRSPSMLCPFVMSDAAAKYSRLMRLGACGFAAGLHSL